MRGGISTYNYAGLSPIKYFDRTGLITECELFALQLIINRAGIGPRVSPGDIRTDPYMSGELGSNSMFGPIVLNTNPNDPNSYSGSVTANNRSAGAVITGIHENVHRGQNVFERAMNKIAEAFSRGEFGQAASTANDVPTQYPTIVKDFEDLVEQCRRCRQIDPVVWSY